MKDDGYPEKGYSEFHFGAGEASIIRIVSEIEEAPEQFNRGNRERAAPDSY